MRQRELISLESSHQNALGLLLQPFNLGEHEHIIALLRAHWIVEIPHDSVLSPESSVDLFCILIWDVQDPSSQVTGEAILFDQYEHDEAGLIGNVSVGLAHLWRFVLARIRLRRR